MTKWFLITAMFACTPAWAKALANNPPIECGAGDYVLTVRNNHILINGAAPIQQHILLNEGHQLTVWLLEGMGEAAEYQRNGKDMQLKLFDYPDGVHPRLADRMDCHIIRQRSK